MALNVIKLKPDDSKILDFIVENLIEDDDEKPSAEHLRMLLNDDRTYILAAVLDDAIIGYALAYRFPSLYSSDYLAYLYDIEVLENHRRKGAGRLLVETLLKYLEADGVDELWLGTATDNVEGQALFASTGGMRSGETFNDFTYEV